MRNKIITSFFCLLLAVSALIGLLMPDGITRNVKSAL